MNKEKKHILDLMILSDDFNLLKDKKETLKEYDQKKQKAFKSLSSLILSLNLNTNKKREVINDKSKNSSTKKTR